MSVIVDMKEKVIAQLLVSDEGTRKLVASMENLVGNTRKHLDFQFEAWVTVSKRMPEVVRLAYPIIARNL